MRGYAELATDIALSAFYLFYKAKAWKYLREKKPAWTDTIQVPWRNKPINWGQFLAELAIDDIDMLVIPDAVPRIEFTTGSLYKSLKIMLALSITSSDKNFRLCDECKSPFIAKDPRARFCSARCSTRSRQRRFLENHRKTKIPVKKSGVKDGVELSPKTTKKPRKPMKK